METKKERKLKLKEELINLKIQTKNREKKYKKRVDINWIIKIVLISLTLSFTFSLISEVSLSKINLIFQILLVLLFIGIGIFFDMIGVSVTSSSEEPFHSMAARKVRGAKTAVKFKKSADKVSSFCCDVVGDVCGVVSGSAGVIIAASISEKLNSNSFLIVLIVTAIISALTIGGKAVGKSFAVNKSNIILYKFSKFVSHFNNENKSK